MSTIPITIFIYRMMRPRLPFLFILLYAWLLVTMLFLPSIAMAQTHAERIKTILKYPGAENYEQRLLHIRSLGHTLSLKEQKSLCDFLKTEEPSNKKEADKFNTLKNDIADKLLNQKTLYPDLYTSFLDIMEDDTLSVVWRDYIVQKIPDLFERLNHHKDQQSKLLQILHEQLNIREDTFAGTSLLGLRRLKHTYPKYVSVETLRDKGCKIASDPSYSEANRTTALQVAAHEQSKQALQIAHDILHQTKSNENFLLRASALATLGILGTDAESLQLIQAHLKDHDYRIRRAATVAWEKRQ